MVEEKGTQLKDLETSLRLSILAKTKEACSDENSKGVDEAI